MDSGLRRNDMEGGEGLEIVRNGTSGFTSSAMSSRP